MEPTISLKLSYTSEEGDRLSDLGNGRVLIQNPQKPDRILNRKTGEIIQATEFHGLGWDIVKILAIFLLLAASVLWLYHTKDDPTSDWLLEMQRRAVRH